MFFLLLWGINSPPSNKVSHHQFSQVCVCLCMSAPFFLYMPSCLFTIAWEALYQTSICRSGTSAQPFYGENGTSLSLPHHVRAGDFLQILSSSRLNKLTGQWVHFVIYICSCQFCRIWATRLSSFPLFILFDPPHLNFFVFSTFCPLLPGKPASTLEHCFGRIWPKSTQIRYWKTLSKLIFH